MRLLTYLMLGLLGSLGISLAVLKSYYGSDDYSAMGSYEQSDTERKPETVSDPK